MPTRARKAPASPLPPSAEGLITRLAAVHVKASCDLNPLLARAGLSQEDIEDNPSAHRSSEPDHISMVLRLVVDHCPLGQCASVQ